MVSTIDNLIKQIDGASSGKERVRSAIAIIRDSSDAMPIRPAAKQVLCPRNIKCEKGPQPGPFKNQDDSSTGENACQASIASAVRLFDKHGMLVDNGFTQRTVVSKGAEVPRW